MSQGKGISRKKICNHQLQAVGGKPLLSCLSEYACCTGAWAEVQPLSHGLWVSEFSTAGSGQQADPGRLATPLFCWKKHVSKRMADSPCSLCKRSTGSPVFWNTWYGVVWCVCVWDASWESMQEGGGGVRRREEKREKRYWRTQRVRKTEGTEVCVKIISRVRKKQ